MKGLKKRNRGKRSTDHRRYRRSPHNDTEKLVTDNAGRTLKDRGRRIRIVDHESLTDDTESGQEKKYPDQGRERNAGDGTLIDLFDRTGAGNPGV